MKVICGLGNPGERFRFTRHNVGFRVVDLLADRWALTGQGGVRDGAAVVDATLPEPVGRVRLVKPMKYMNLSGGPLRSALRQTDVDPATELLVVYDDADLELGRVRLRPAGSAGGHNGMRDIIAALGTDAFPRLRIGVGRNGRGLAGHVLATFHGAERDLAAEMVQVAADAVETWLGEGLDAAMNRFNAIDQRDGA